MRLFLSSNFFNFNIKVPGRLVSNYHITFLFIGESDPKPIIQKLSKINFNSFSVELDELGQFKSVIWVGLKPKKPLIDLANKISKVLEIKNNFQPHITLSRIKSKQDLPKLKLKKTIVIKEFFLVKSTLTSNGPIYEKIAVFKAEDYKNKL